MYIVLEYLLIENFIINFLILYLTKILVRSNVRYRRIIIGAAISSLYSLVFFSPKTLFLTLPLPKLILSALLIRITFKYINFKFFLKELIAFYIISFIFAGATLGIFYSSKSNTKIWDMGIDILNGFPVKYLIIGVLISLIGGKLIFKYYHQKVLKENYIIDLTISYNEQNIKLRALLDTGNSLVVPFTNKQVVVVEYEKLKEVLPSKMEELIRANWECNYKLIEELLKDLQEQINLTLIPFNSIGKSGMLFGFKPDYLMFNYLGNEYIKKDIIVGIFSGTLEKEMGYSGLLHYELINGGVEHEYIKVQN
ncbi:sigma-E processing peptidase SpoIIGA [Tissierella sp. Yu-01]|uniref:sigma-E processing peptidase SpoIIGA n=1 Tax=Tissierella sp. Yu-01 TaxID=3035694 RepID=UPI00240E6CEE|nr:sigma-E processing peptidase SpoIIGA [Tissierella sp. Yu-01]WFA09639.1 sigma-E processing peptidase SpoIIGA [Tissierella sp. Yu-01]